MNLLQAYIFTLLFLYILTSTFNKEHRDLEELKNNLEKNVKERTKQLKQANKKLKKTNKKLEITKKKLAKEIEVKSTFFMNLIHEFKTPLAVIKESFENYMNTHKKDKQRKIKRFL